jgi:hypothetical protein
VADMDLLAETRAIVEQARGGSPGAGSLVDVVGNGALVVSGARVGVTIPDPAVPVPALNVPPGRSTRLAQAGGVV